MTIESAASRLSAMLFGEPRSFLRIGSVRIDDRVLHVRTCVPPEKWPPDRAESFGGYPVTWQYIGKNAGLITKSEQLQP